MSKKNRSSVKTALSFHDLRNQAQQCTFRERVGHFSRFIAQMQASQEHYYLREIVSPPGRVVDLIDPQTWRKRTFRMFGSNNYLGLANHPSVCEAMRRAVTNYGAGVSGPPLLNGYTRLHRELEERLSAFKQAEDTLIFPTGYAANTGLITALTTPRDLVCYDELSHASLCDGLKLARATAQSFRHNDLHQLRQLLEDPAHAAAGDRFVGVEGVYSMDGDLAPLDRMVPLCRKHRAILILDDAHGSGVMGASGRGTAEHFGMEGQIDITMGTFSKTFGVVGGFVSADKAVIDYLRYFARSYMFSASLPPAVIAAVLAGLEVIAREPERREQLQRNVRYLADGLERLGLPVHPEAAIIALRVPRGMNIRAAAGRFHQAGIFLNAIEYPAVPLDEQRFRISVMADHTREDLDQLLETVGKVWGNFENGELRNGTNSDCGLRIAD